MVRDVTIVRVNEEACQQRFDAFSRVIRFFFFSFSHILSRQILSVRSFSLSFSLLLLLLSPDDDHLYVLRCCVWRNVGCRRLFAVSEKRKRIYMGGGFHLR